MVGSPKTGSIATSELGASSARFEASAPGRVRNGSGGAYQVFTPFSKAWTDHGWRDPVEPPTGGSWLGLDDGTTDIPDPSLPDGLELPEAGEDAALRRWGDFLAEIDIGIWEQQLDEDSWQGFVTAKRDIARVSIESGGSISACHGSCRAGEVDLVPLELGGAYEVMKTIKRALDPNNVMNPGKYLLDSAYDAEGREEV